MGDKIDVQAESEIPHVLREARAAKKLFVTLPAIFLSFMFVCAHLLEVFCGGVYVCRGVFGFSKVLYFVLLPVYFISLSILTCGYSYSVLLSNLKSNVVVKPKIIAILLFSQFGWALLILLPWVEDYPNIDFDNVSSVTLVVLYFFYFLPALMYMSLLACLRSK